MIDPEGEDESVAAALRRLPREIAPPPHVRAAVAARVPSRAGRAAFRAAVAASLLVAAFVAGRATAPAPATPASGQKFALLLYGGAVGGGDDRASEYAAWAMEELRRHSSRPDRSKGGELETVKAVRLPSTSEPATAALRPGASSRERRTTATRAQAHSAHANGSAA